MKTTSKMPLKSQLPRLPKDYYRGPAYVFWTYTIEGKVSGWLDPAFHTHFREVLLHCLARYCLACPVYVLMPDHMHFIWVGASSESDQLIASTFFRKVLNKRLSPVSFQRQAHDHVLRENEREIGRFADTADYIRQNPVRAGLVSEPKDWEYAGAMIPGYPDLAWNKPIFQERFWKSYQAYVVRLNRESSD
jgi:REP element-mobilizing transposase RayT